MLGGCSTWQPPAFKQNSSPRLCLAEKDNELPARRRHFSQTALHPRAYPRRHRDAKGLTSDPRTGDGAFSRLRWPHLETGRSQRRTAPLRRPGAGPAASPSPWGLQLPPRPGPTPPPNRSPPADPSAPPSARSSRRAAAPHGRDPEAPGEERTSPCCGRLRACAGGSGLWRAQWGSVEGLPVGAGLCSALGGRTDSCRRLSVSS